MFPGIYDFKWDPGHIVFLGIFYSVLMIVLSTLLIAATRGFRDFRRERVQSLQWHSDFEDLPEAARVCRHELAGEVEKRTCPNAFDCRHCEEHPKLQALRADQTEPAPETQIVAGFELPADRLYHRGHTWVRAESDGTMTVGLDDLAVHLIGTPDGVMMPAVGTHLVANGMGWEVRKLGNLVRVMSPLDGDVIAVGGPAEGWYLKVKPDGEHADTRHLLTLREAKPWMLREVERLQIALSSEKTGATLTDGGVPVDDLSKVIPPHQLDEVCGLMFLQP